MKNIKFLFINLLLVGTFISCDKSLDLEPEDSLTPSVIFSNQTLAQSALEGMYSNCQQADALSGTFDAMTEWQSDNVNFVGSFPTFNEIKDYAILSANGSIANVWIDHYEVINNANVIIARVPNVSDPNFIQADKDNMVGQAKFIRALMFFRLSQSFGVQLKQDPTGNQKSIPLALVPFEGNVLFPSRNTLNEVYNQIEADLLSAEMTITNTSKAKATAASAQALLARLYLYKENWSGAATYAQKVISTPGISMAANYSFYNAASPEHVFQLQNVAGDAQGGASPAYSSLFNPVLFGGRGDCPFSQDLKDLFLLKPTDLRYSITLTRSGNNAGNVLDLFTRKYPNGTRTDDPNVLRVSEMHLIRCEANFKGGLSVGGIAPLVDLNRTAIRAGLSGANLYTVVNNQNILDERRKEFCFEGLRRMDLLRNNLPLRPATNAQFAKSAPNQPYVTFPIPQREIDINPALSPNNAGY